MMKSRTKTFAKSILNCYQLFNEPRFRSLPGKVQRAIIFVRARNLTYLSHLRLIKLAELCLHYETTGKPGIILETGCALGGSSIVLASAKSSNRELHIYDVFGLIPPPSDRDGADVHQRYETICSGQSKGIGRDLYYGYETDLLSKVFDNFKKAGYPPEQNRIRIVQGLIRHTLSVDGPVALAHIDVDWHDPVFVSIERIEPWLIEGGTIVFDDYLDWSGCKTAADTYFDARRSDFVFDTSDGSLCVQRKH